MWMSKNEGRGLFSGRDIILALLLSAAYLLLSSILIGFKTDQLFLIAFFNICYFFNFSSRRFIIGFSIFIVYWIIFDYMKAIPNYRINTVHIQDLYDTEKSLFGINADGKTFTPNEYLLTRQGAWKDVMAGLFYLCWIPVPLAFAFYLFLRSKALFLQFSFTFVLVNFIGFVIYYVYPAAPPWYMQLYGSHFIQATPGNTAGLIRFDNITGLSIFKNLYAKSSNVFAAMPSLHSSYPVIVLYYGLKKKVPTVAVVFFSVVMVGIWLSAVYTSHHYVLDVLAGVSCALLGILLFKKVLLKTSWFNNFFNAFLLKIS